MSLKTYTENGIRPVKRIYVKYREPMQSNITRRNRWFQLLTHLDPSYKIDDKILGDMLLDNAMIQHWQRLLILTSTHNKIEFALIEAALMEQIIDIHKLDVSGKSVYSGNGGKSQRLCNSKGKGSSGNKGQSKRRRQFKFKASFNTSQHMPVPAHTSLWQPPTREPRWTSDASLSSNEADWWTSTSYYTDPDDDWAQQQDDDGESYDC